MPKPKRKPKTAASNEQTPDAGGGGYAGESRGGFDPLMGWTTAIGLGTAGIVYAKTQAPRTNIPVPKVRGKETWTVKEQSDYYAGQAASLERESRMMSHPSYFSSVKFNEQDNLFIQMQQIKLKSEADRLRRRANTIARGIPKKK